MDLNLNVLRLASGLASYSSTRQAIISENIANSDTPGFRARDVEEFSSALGDRLAPLSARMTRPQHIPFTTESQFRVLDATIPGAESPNGNSVSLEDQMMRAAEVRQSHDMALGVYQKSLDILRGSLGR